MAATRWTYAGTKCFDMQISDALADRILNYRFQRLLLPGFKLLRRKLAKHIGRRLSAHVRWPYRAASPIGFPVHHELCFRPASRAFSRQPEKVDSG